IRARPGNVDLLRRRGFAIKVYCPCPGPGNGFCGRLGAGPGAPGGATGGKELSTWPSIGASAEARRTTPMTMRIIGKVLPNDKKPPRNWSRRNSKPTVMMTAGPIKLRMVQRRHAQRMRLLIEVHPPNINALGAVAQTIAKQQDADANQYQRPQAPYKMKRKPVKIVQKKKNAKRDQDNRAHGPVFAPGLQRIRGGFAEAFRFGSAHGVKCHV